MSREISYEVQISAPLSEVWKAWTTEQGAKSFFAPECQIELHVGGAYEMYFDPEASRGERGGEGLTILAIQEERMLSFTWNAPPTLPAIRGQLTHITLRFQELEEGRTALSLVHDGWGDGGEWDQAFDYFTRAWGEVVLPRLEYRFEHGPIDWKNLPALGKAS
ncbi:MAG: SRPBCC domain-containing protein [Anaerolineales bacterium]